MARAGINRKTLQYILIGVLVVGLAYLFLNGVKEGFKTDTVELFHTVPPSGATEKDKIYSIPAELITSKKDKKLNSIKLQRFDKGTQKYVDVNMANVAGNKPTFPRFSLKGCEKLNEQNQCTGNAVTGLYNSTYRGPLLSSQRKLPLSTSDPALRGGIDLINLDSNPLEITTTNSAANPKNNLKIILEFVD